MIFGKLATVFILSSALLGANAMAQVQITPEKGAETLHLTPKWDKIFPQSNKVEHHKVVFKNRYGITLAADLYLPKGMKTGEKLAAIAVSGPFGAVKEQVSGLYAQTLAEHGFVTLAFDPSYTGESGGSPHNLASPEINTDDFSAAVDFLSLQNFVDADKIGILGICGWGGMALSAAAIDTRIKATATSTMYDMSRLFAYGYNDSVSADQRQQERIQYNKNRTQNAKNGVDSRFAPLPDKVDNSQPQFVQEYINFYKTKRGFHPRAVGSSSNADGWVSSMPLAFMNTHLLDFANEIQTPVLLVHGEKAHSLYFSKDAFKKLTGHNKELYIVPGANHTDLYDNRAGKIPYDKFEQFFKANLH